MTTSRAVYSFFAMKTDFIHDACDEEEIVPQTFTVSRVYSVVELLMVMVGVMLMVMLVRGGGWCVVYESSKSRWGFEFCYGPSSMALSFATLNS